MSGTPLVFVRRTVRSKMTRMGPQALHPNQRYVSLLRENRAMSKIKKLNAKVLIVDDDELICTLMKLYLTGLGDFEFWVAHNGLAALNMAQRIHPDLVISDITMPIMDGITLVSHLRKDEKLRKMPIIMVSGTSDALKDKAYAAGADMVLEKPLVRKYLINAIEKLLPRPK